MRRLRVGVLDLVATAPSPNLWGRVMNANLASIMPQAISAWCEEEGHEVRYVCYTGTEALDRILPRDTDLLFIGAFTEAAQLAYAISQLYRSRGTVTALGGPHARCYPEDAAGYFDYVLGLTDKNVVRDVLNDCAPHRPVALSLSAAQQPSQLPGVRARWKYIDAALKKAPTFKMVPMLASLGCPYTCSFCIDSTVEFHAFEFDQLKDDLRFLRGKMRRPLVGWHDPNFGVRFDETLGAIEEAVPPGSVDFAAESSLSLLSEPRLVRLRKNGFRALLPGIESWFSLGNKSKTSSLMGLEKVNQVAEHVNMILRYVPYVQTNFVFGLDCDEGTLPFELTKRFVDLVPGAFPAYSLLTAFGRAAPLNLEFQRAGRVLPFPHHFLNNTLAMNVRPANYQWPAFYDNVIDLTRHTFSARAIGRRFAANRTAIPKWLNVVRAVAGEGRGRLRYYRKVRHLLQTDSSARSYFDGEATTLPSFYADRVRQQLGKFWALLPEGGLHHDVNAYLRAEAAAPISLGLARAMPVAGTVGTA